MRTSWEIYEKSFRWPPFIWKDSGLGLFQELLRKPAEIHTSCQLALFKKTPSPPLTTFYEILAVWDGFTPFYSRVRSAPGLRAARESQNGAVVLLAASCHWTPNFGRIFQNLRWFSMGCAKILPNSALRNPQRKLWLWVNHEKVIRKPEKIG